MKAALWMTTHGQGSQRLAGLTLLERAQLTLRHFGATQVVVIVEEGEALQALQAEHPSMDAFLTRAQWEAMVALDPGPRWLLGRADHVYDKRWKGVVEGMRRAGHTGVVSSRWGSSALWMHDGEQILSGAISSESPSHMSSPACFDIHVTDAPSARKAEDALWNSCRKDLDGLISRNLNRHLSLFISRRLVNLPIKPNHISVFCIFLGLMSGFFALQGDYTGVLLGALFLKANSVIDGVDGELARVKWEYSKAGELLDSVGDNVANFSFFGALTYATYYSGDVFFGQLGMACLAMWVSYIGFLYAQLFKLKRGDVLMVRQNVDEVATGWLKQLVHLLRTVILRRDGYVFVILLLALLGTHKVLIGVMCAGAAIPFLGMLIHYGLEWTRVVSPKRA